MRTSGSDRKERTVRRRTWAGLGIGATATLAATAMMSGALGPSGGSVGVLLTPPAAATELTRFTGCEELISTTSVD